MKLPRPTCINCKKEFDLKEESIPFYLESKAKGMVFIMVDCSNCNRTTGFNPSEPEKSNLKKESPVWRTPVSGINGFVSFIEEEDGSNFYGCGESGFIWLTKERFYQSIEEIIEDYAHRADCYKKVGNDWLPSDEEPQDIDDLIEAEDDNDLEDYLIE